MIGALITTVRVTFATILAEGDGFRRDGSQVNLMLSDGDAFGGAALDRFASEECEPQATTCRPHDASTPRLHYSTHRERFEAGVLAYEA